MELMMRGPWSWWWHAANKHDSTARAILSLSIPILLLLWLVSLSKLKRLPPGPPGLPLFGHLLSLRPNLHEHFTELGKRYGPIVRIYLGTRLAMVISSPTMAEQVLKEHDSVFANRDPPAAGMHITYGGEDITWSPNGPRWRMLRRVCVHEMLSPTALDALYGLRRHEVQRMVGAIHSKSGEPVNVGEYAFMVIIGTVTKMLLGGSREEQGECEEVGVEFRSLVGEITELLGRPNLGDALPSMALLDLQGVKKDLERVFPRFDLLINSMVEKRSKMGVGHHPDFLDYLLKVKDSGNDQKTPLNMNNVKALLMDMVVGGTDTSANTVEWAMAEMLHRPEILDRAREELEEVVGTDRTVEESDVPKLHYLKAVIKETLRLHPVLPLLVPHCPSSSCKVGNYIIPKGTRVFINVWAIHRDPEFWNNPLDFDPERFLREPEWDFTGKDFRYLPFGSGRRICAGIGMAERMVGFTLASLIHSFDWRLPAGGENIDLSEKFGIVMKKAVPLLVIPEPRLAKTELYH